MAIPDFQAVMLPVLECLSDGQERRMRDVTEAVSEKFGLTEDERQQLVPSGYTRVIVNRVGWAKHYMKEAGLLEAVKRGVVRITDQGKKVLAERPERIDNKYLQVSLFSLNIRSGVRTARGTMAKKTRTNRKRWM